MRFVARVCQMQGFPSAQIMLRKQAPMSDPVQPTSSQNAQNAAVENQSIAQFEDWEIVAKNNICFKSLPEKVSFGFSLGKGIDRAWHAVKEGVSAFFQKLFGEKSKARMVPSGVKMSAVNAKKGSLPVRSQTPSVAIVSGVQTNVPDIKQRETTVPPKPQVPHNNKVSIYGSSTDNGQNASFKTTVSERNLPKPTVSQTPAFQKENGRNVSVGSSRPESVP